MEWSLTGRRNARARSESAWPWARNPSTSLKLVLSQGVTLVAGGVLAGLILTIALARVLRRVILIGDAANPWTFLGVTLLLTVIALGACYIPARRAMKVEPTIALRHE